jgi:dCMP deaminase
MRPTRDVWAMSLALATAKRATCLRRSVGCVLLNFRGHVLATGYNGVAAGQPHCNELSTFAWAARQGDPGKKISFKNEYPRACLGAQAPSGTNLDGCQAIHAEQNAMLQCRDIHAIDTCYVTTSPCMTCTKLLLNTSCRRIVFQEEYPHAEARDLWVNSGRQWEQLKCGNTP